MSKDALLRTVRIGSLAIFATLLIASNMQSKAAWVGSEGDEWLQWDRTAKDAYVRAYVTGLDRGFTRGCDEGVSAAEPKAKGGIVIRDISECLTHSPISKRDSMEMVDTITEFYTQYPKQRFLYISDILLNLHQGQSIQQIHERYAGSAR